MWPFTSTPEAGPSKSAVGDVQIEPEKPRQSRWESIYSDEEKYQAKIYPTKEELPSCMTLL